MPSYVYFISDGISTKIGKSNDVLGRLASLQTGNPKLLNVYGTVRCESEEHALILEKDLHTKCSNSKIKGEWFNLPIQTLLELFKHYKADYDHSLHYITTLNSQSKVYAPKQDQLRYIRGEYMINLETKYSIIKELGDSAWLLYEFFYEKRRYNHFAPTDDKAIAEAMGWSSSKVARIKTLLKKHNLLLILKDTTRDGTVLYRTILQKHLIEFYLEHNTLPDDVDVDCRDIPKETK